MLLIVGSLTPYWIFATYVYQQERLFLCQCGRLTTGFSLRKWNSLNVSTRNQKTCLKLPALPTRLFRSVNGMGHTMVPKSANSDIRRAKQTDGQYYSLYPVLSNVFGALE